MGQGRTGTGAGGGGRQGQGQGRGSGMKQGREGADTGKGVCFPSGHRPLARQTARTEPVPPPERNLFVQVHLDPLSTWETLEVLCAVLKVDNIEPRLAALVFRHTDGNPGFMEQVWQCPQSQAADPVQRHAPTPMHSAPCTAPRARTQCTAFDARFPCTRFGMWRRPRVLSRPPARPPASLG